MPPELPERGDHPQTISTSASLVIAAAAVLVIVLLHLRLGFGNTHTKPLPPSSRYWTSILDTIVFMRCGGLLLRMDELICPTFPHQMACYYPFGQPVVVLKDRQLKRKLLLQRKPELRPDFGPNYKKLHGEDLQLMSGPKYELLRKKLTCIISPRALESYLPELLQQYGSMLSRLADQGTKFSLSKELQLTQLYLSCKLFAGMEFDFNSEEFQKFSTAYELVMAGMFALGSIQKSLEASEHIKGVFKGQAVSKLEVMRAQGCFTDSEWKPANGFEALLHALAETESLTDEAMQDVVSIMLLLVEAGHVTTVHSITSTIALLNETKNWPWLQAARIEARAIQEMSVPKLMKMELVRGCINEGLRLMPIISSIPKKIVSGEAFELGDHTIPAGATIMIPICEALEDPEVFEEPHTFDPERWQRIKEGLKSGDAEVRERCERAEEEFIQFSIGMHDCLGKPVAMLSMHTFLTLYLRSYDFVDVEPWGKKVAPLPSISVDNGFHAMVKKVAD